MRRCSFSSSVLARLRGGRAVLGSGSTWPHDFRFLTGFDSEPAEAGVSDVSEQEGKDVYAGEGMSKGTWRSSILIVVGAEVVGGGVVRAAEAMRVVVFMVWEKKESRGCSVPIASWIVDAK